MRRQLLTRAGLALVALAGVAWFALGIYQAHALDGAGAIVAKRSISAAQARRAEHLLDDAQKLYPGQDPTILRSKLAFARGETTLARRLAARAAHAEPDNAQAWLQLVRVSHGTPQLAPAFRHLVKLVPAVSGAS